MKKKFGMKNVIKIINISSTEITIISTSIHLFTFLSYLMLIVGAVTRIFS